MPGVLSFSKNLSTDFFFLVNSYGWNISCPVLGLTFFFKSSGFSFSFTF